MDPIASAKETLQIEANALLSAAETIDQSFIEALKIISNTNGKVIITGVGKSGLVGAKIAATFASTGTSSFFLHPTEALHGDLGMISKGDTLIAISSSGESEELTRILPHIKRFDIPLIAMTGNPHSTLSKYANTTLNIFVDQEACPLNAAPTSSTTLTMALGDALAIALMHQRGFKENDFASYHPGGSLGKRLFVKTEDLMVTKNLPIVSNSSTLKEAILVMSEGKLGTVLIVNEENKLEALLSDGDLRRALMDKDFDLSHKAVKYANSSPVVIDQKQMLASEAFKIIESKKIQAVVITNKAHTPIGILHLHTLVDNGIIPA